jgi:hypothetical protein
VYVVEGGAGKEGGPLLRIPRKCRSRCVAAVVRCAHAGTIGRAQLAGSLHGGRAARLVVAGARRRLFDGLWPEYNHHGNHTGRYFGSLPPGMPTRRSCSPTGAPAASSPGARPSLPLGRDPRNPPSGNRCLGLQAISEPHRPTALSALGRRVVAAMAAVARRHDLAPLVAPVRPSWKDRYPPVAYRAARFFGFPWSDTIGRATESASP